MNLAAKTAPVINTDDSTIDALRLLSANQPAPPPPPVAEPPRPAADRLTLRFADAPTHPVELLAQLPIAALPHDDWEPIRQLRDTLWEAQETNPDNQPLSVIGISGLTSAAERWALATALWASHKELRACRVLLLDADLTQAPSQQLEPLTAAPGFVDLIEDPALELSKSLQRIHGTQLYLLGPGNPTEEALDPLDFRAARPILAELRQHFDFIFVHLPDLAEPTNLAAWTRLTDGVVLACRRQQDTYQGAQALLTAIPAHKALGWVML